MPGRPPNPTSLQLLTGAFSKDPARGRRRANEPQPPSRMLEMPAHWTVQHVLAHKIKALAIDGMIEQEIAEELKIPFRDVRDVLRGRYAQADRLRAIWENCIAMWPWLTFSDRDALEHYCVLKLKQDEGNLSGAELTAIARIRSELGGTGSGRARLGMLNAPSAPAEKKKGSPRAEFLARKTG